MTRKEVEQKAFDYFQSGYICSESIAKTIVEEFAETQPHDIPKVTTGLGGGIGGSKCETCGALSGGIVALGFLFGRMDPGVDNKRVFHLASEFRGRFHDSFGAANCGELLEGFGAQEGMSKCKRLTAEAAGILYDILCEEVPCRA